ncbi:hypothetical protein K402DRAFT_245048 [Aulographum hederae CBS 113979]|uniref:Uncharacterized protein n=1 Tax=Aulographum hederae CBS 113979 TaxID=1176131 RepID=A0A6G1HAA5_9PEZI|nr:hypothetical protein K402DRAFT_245048 [Aulographum hederae CBS 113979]
MSSLKLILLTALTSSFHLTVAEECNASVATQQYDYAGTFTWQGQTMTVGHPEPSSRTISGNFQATATPTGGSSSSDSDSDAANAWLGDGEGAVGDVGFRRVKRQSDDATTVECMFQLSMQLAPPSSLMQELTNEFV